MNPRAHKTPLAAARSFVAENSSLNTMIQVRYLRPRTGYISHTVYYASNGKVEPDRGGYDHRNGFCPVCGKVYLEPVVEQVWTQPEGNLYTVACPTCAAQHGWDAHWRPGVQVPDKSVAWVNPGPYIYIDMISGVIEERQYS